ncbi:helix-turn-helix domain-containing protein [Natrinema zhouii]|uniref:Helix-turn-helix domain-containing protein n=1 Tax=Natrinema zhouii TaxID=1710539 RepID=A0A7D6CR94_9EURY|nr:bacterio-opsin activator domain-containing protein [Natrinema zhouii]QLK26749.1 helix-turn-helix domain-containing protein [Natrinema zhouii]
MSDTATTAVGDVPCVLVVGDADAADDAMETLAARFEGASLLRERTLEGARERLADREVHCLVCPFSPATDGRSGSADSLLERLAAGSDERPIVAVTDSEDADHALAAGASDVVDRDESPTVLTARVRNAAERARLRLAAADSDRRHWSILESAAAVVWVLDADGDIEYATPAVESRMGFTPAELERTAIRRLVHPDDRETVLETLATVTDAPVGTTDRVSPRLGHADGTWHVSELTLTNRLADPTVEGVVVTRTGGRSAADSTVPDGIRRGVDRLEDAFFTLGPRDELRYANDAAIALFTDVDTEASTDAATGPDTVTDTDPGIDPDTDEHSSDHPRLIGAVVWDLLPDELSEALYDRVRAAETTGSAETVRTTLPSIEGRLAVTVHPGDDGVSVHARERPADATASSDRDRLALLESVVDALDDGIAVLEGTTIRLVNSALLELADADALVGRELEDVFAADLAATVRERARSPVIRWMEPVSGMLATDAAPPVEVFVAPLTDPDRTLCVVRDRRGSRGAALSSIRRTLDTLRRAETASAVRNAATDAVREFAAADVAVWYRADDDWLRPATVAMADHIGDHRSIELPPIDPDGSPLADTLENRETVTDPESEGVTVYERAELEDFLARAGLRAERVLAAPIADRGIVLATGMDPMTFDGSDSDPIEAVSDAASVALESLENADDLRACQHDRARLETVLERMERVWDAGQSLLAADTREAVERRLCEAIVSLAPLESGGSIELAWVGHADDGRKRVVPSTWAGRDGEFLESTTVPLATDADAPTGVAAATRELTVLDDLSIDGSEHATESQSWRRQLLERGFRSALSVTLTVDGVRHGTLTAYADRPSAFDERTRRVCHHLASIAGAVIAAIETKRALLADRITELEVVLRNDAEALSSVARGIGRRLDVQAIVPRSSGGSTVFCTVDGGDADAIHETVGALAAVDAVSIVDRGSGGTALEIGLREPTIARTIADHGGILRSVTPVDDRCRLVIELGEPVDVRSFLGLLERTYPGTELVARRKRDRSHRPVRPFDELRERLSERQRRTLEAAYYSGFFEWPREHTGEEVAESLGISQPTFSRHLRLAQRKLFALLFDEFESD